jgi:hypothetical protein
MAIAACASALNDRAPCTSIAQTRYDALTCGPFHRSRGRAGQARCCNPTGSNRPRAVVFETAISYRLMGLPVPKPRCPAVARLNPEDRIAHHRLPRTFNDVPSGVFHRGFSGCIGLGSRSFANSIGVQHAALPASRNYVSLLPIPFGLAARVGTLAVPGMAMILTEQQLLSIIQPDRCSPTSGRHFWPNWGIIRRSSRNR